MDVWIGKIAVVTDASVEIGAAIAKALVRAGVLVVGLARRLDELAELSESLKGAQGKLYPKQCGLSTAEDLLDAFKWIEAEFGGVDILIANTSVNGNRVLIDDDADSLRNMLYVNCLVIAISMRESAASMQRRNVAGHIFVINSVDGRWLSLGQSRHLDAPSEFSVTALTERMRSELAATGKNIQITSVSPGNHLTTDIMRATGASDHERFFDYTPSRQPQIIAESVIYALSILDCGRMTDMAFRFVGEEN